jgi:hypothetical protein
MLKVSVWVRLDADEVIVQAFPSTMVPTDQYVPLSILAVIINLHQDKVGRVQDCSRLEVDVIASAQFDGTVAGDDRAPAKDGDVIASTAESCAQSKMSLSDVGISTSTMIG